MSDKAKGKKGENAKSGDGAETAKGKKGALPEGAMSVAAHPRAAAQVRRARGWGSLVAFLLTLYVSVSHGVSPDIAALRAIIVGIAGGIVARGCAVMVWRHLMIAELRARIERAKAQLEVPAE
jgi:ABC-type uncharacterized transport system permease subunit